MFKMIKNELKCSVHSFVVRIPGEGLDNWEVAGFDCFDTKAASGVILQALYAQTSLIFVAFVHSKYMYSFTFIFRFFLIVRLD